MKFYLLFSFLISSLCFADTNFKSCLSSKEFITTHQFLKQKKFSLSEKQILEISQDVSQGCNGSAISFIKVFDLLSKVGVPSHKSLKVAKNFINAPNYSSKAFTEIFKKSYLAGQLDQNVDFSLDLALSLTKDTEAEYENILYDFNKLLGFCLSSKHLDLPRTQCAQMIKEVSLNGHHINQKVSNAFIGVFKFLTQSKKGPQLSTYKAFYLAKELSAYGNDVEANIIHAYRYAQSEKGLKLSPPQALDFAMNLAKMTLKKI